MSDGLYSNADSIHPANLMDLSQKKGAPFHPLVDHHVHSCSIPVVLHKAAAEVSKIGKLKERLVVANHGWQSELTGRPLECWAIYSSV